MIRPEQLRNYGPAPGRAGTQAVLERLSAGPLNIRSGELALGNLGMPGGCDPEAGPHLEVPLGPHQVDVSLYRWWYEGPALADEGADVTAVSIMFADRTPDRWEMWTSDNEPVRSDVDHGLAAVFDYEDADEANDLSENADSHILAPLWEYQNTPWFVWHHGILSFRCGLGDGMYEIWLGFDSRDQFASIVIDLELLPDLSS